MVGKTNILQKDEQITEEKILLFLKLFALLLYRRTIRELSGDFMTSSTRRLNFHRSVQVRGSSMSIRV
jgi:hypothetical protein